VNVEPGRLLMHRNVRHGRIGWVRPGRVVSDDERGLLIWIARHSPVVNEVSADGRGMRTMPFTEWITAGTSLRQGTWNGPGVLKLIRPEAAHSVWWFRDDRDRFANWYVNLERPARRWDDGSTTGVAGVDIVDEDLDIVVSPDRAWQWKDEEEFLERLALPEHYWVSDEAAVRAEGERVIKEIEAGVFPFDGTWCDWQPPPAWAPPPELPAGWDRPTMY
jgi:Protein of unknown function (DUF402)